jgi:hypothetical protein
MTQEFLPLVEPGSMGAPKPFHAGYQVGTRAFDYPTKTCLPCPAQVGGSTSNNTHKPASPVCMRHAQAGGFGARLAEGFQKAPTMLIILENGFRRPPRFMT